MLRRRSPSTRWRRPGDTEGAQGTRGFLHGETNHIAARAVDALDDIKTVTLRGVGAGFVERVYFFEITGNRPIRERAKMHARNFVQTFCAPAREIANKNRRANFVHATAQASQNFCGINKIGGLADDYSIEPDQRVGAKNNCIGNSGRDCQCFACCVANREFADSQRRAGNFRDRRREDLKPVPGVF